MGFLSSEHIKQFCWHKKIKWIHCDDPRGNAIIEFTNGTTLKLSVGNGDVDRYRIKSCGCVVEVTPPIHAVPYKENGEVKQSVDIMREIQP